MIQGCDFLISILVALLADIFFSYLLITSLWYKHMIALTSFLFLLESHLGMAWRLIMKMLFYDIKIHIKPLRPRKMAAISKTTVSNTFSWMKMYEFQISLKFVPQGPISNIPALIQKMARRQSGDKPLSEPMMVRLLTHICITQPQWVKMVSRWSHVLVFLTL